MVELQVWVGCYCCLLSAMDPRTFAMPRTHGNPFAMQPGGSMNPPSRGRMPPEGDSIGTQQAVQTSITSLPPASPPRRMVAEPPGGATYGPMGLTPPTSVSPRRPTTTRRDRQDRASSRERARNEEAYDRASASADFEATIQNWVTRLMSVEKASRVLKQ